MHQSNETIILMKGETSPGKGSDKTEWSKSDSKRVYRELINRTKMHPITHPIWTERTILKGLIKCCNIEMENQRDPEVKLNKKGTFSIGRVNKRQQQRQQGEAEEWFWEQRPMWKTCLTCESEVFLSWNQGLLACFGLQ